MRVTFTILLTLTIAITIAQSIAELNKYDSIAESCFTNSEYKKAINFSKKALSIAKKNIK